MKNPNDESKKPHPDKPDSVEPVSTTPETPLQVVLDVKTINVLCAAQNVSGWFLVLLVVMGFVQIFFSVLCFSVELLHIEFTPFQHSPIQVAFQGLELLLFAPLPFLLLRSIAEYVSDLNRKAEVLSRIARKQITATEGKIEISSSPGKAGLMETKALSIGLLFTIVATHLVGKILGGDSSASAHELSHSQIGVSFGLLLVLFVAFVLIDRFSHRSE